jgi:DNA-binding response OmpR family regulator
MQLTSRSAMTTNTALALQPPQKQSTTVLIVDDNISGAQTLQMLLSLEGFEVLVAHSGEEGIRLYQTHHPHVVLLDIDLPDASGYSIARALREMTTTHALFIIAMTGWGEQHDITKALDSGCDYHLTKPINFDDLGNVINGALIESR